MWMECLLKYLYRNWATGMMQNSENGFKGAFLGIDSCKSFLGLGIPINLP